MLGLILLVIVVLLLVGSLPIWPYSRGWGPFPGIVMAIVLVIVILLVFGRI